MYYFCACEECKKKMEPPKEPVGPRVMIDDWQDFAVGRDDFPKRPAIRALFKSLNTFPNEKPDQYVALWYQSGEPVMGRIWNENGKIAASFSWGGHEYRTKVGSIQVCLHRHCAYEPSGLGPLRVSGARAWLRLRLAPVPGGCDFRQEGVASGARQPPQGTLSRIFA